MKQGWRCHALLAFIAYFFGNCLPCPVVLPGDRYSTYLRATLSNTTLQRCPSGTRNNLPRTTRRLRTLTGILSDFGHTSFPGHRPRKKQLKKYQEINLAFPLVVICPVNDAQQPKGHQHPWTTPTHLAAPPYDARGRTDSGGATVVKQ